MANNQITKLTAGVFFALTVILIGNFAIAKSHDVILNPIKATSFEGIVTAIADFALTLLAPVAILIILYAGALYAFSGGDVEKVKRAHKALFWALVGIAIVLTGKGFISIIKDILKP